MKPNLQHFHMTAVATAFLAILTSLLATGCDKKSDPDASATAAPPVSAPSDAVSTPETPTTVPDARSALPPDTGRPGTAIDDHVETSPSVPPSPSELSIEDLRPIEEFRIVDVQMGTGMAIEDGTWAVVHSHIITENGRVLEDTRAIDKPAEMFFPGLYPEGLSRGIKGMRRGGIRKIEIPPALAFAGWPNRGEQEHVSLYATILCLDVFRSNNVIMPSGTRIMSDQQGSGPRAVEGTFIEYRLLVSVGAEDRIAYDSAKRGGPAEAGIPSPPGIFVQRHLEPELPWFSAALYGMQAGEFRRVEVPPAMSYRGDGYPPLGLRKGEWVRYEITCEKVHAAPTKTLTSGLIIEDIVAGDGDPVIFGRWCEIRERVSLQDGTIIFDNLEPGTDPSYVFVPRAGTLGFNRGMMGLHVGGHRRITIPPHLGYGDIPPSDAPLIKPGSTLVWEVKLIEQTRKRPAEAPIRSRDAQPGIPSEKPPTRFTPG